MDITIYITSAICLLLGLQIQLRELPVLFGKYNYRISHPQFITFISASVALYLGVVQLLHADILMESAATVLTLSAYVISEWILSKVGTSSVLISWLWRFTLAMVLSFIFTILEVYPEADYPSVIPFIIAGVYLRNSPFGIPHLKTLCLAYYIPRIKRDIPFNDNNIDRELIDDSFAGMKQKSLATTIYNVTDYGVRPDSSADQTEQIQHVIDMAGEANGGIVFFPKGRYLVNKKRDTFLQINHSDIALEGEVDAKGHPVAEIVNCGKTSRGHKNPWISPFMITTGEALQPSNEFWGLQFRKRKTSYTRSNSLSDPGSDGNILTPDFATKISDPASVGETTLHVEDSTKVGKYILIGLYNTPDNQLINDILGMSLRPEWTVANRAADEEAPSYQWLVEVKEVLDDHTIQLVRPLLRDIDNSHDPVIFNVTMLENVSIRNLRLNSRWSGMFRHHGFPVYYSIAQSQEMDYGWNAINMKRVAHGEISNVIISNFSNPIYVMDSRNITVRDIIINGHDGHQGIKIYMHACDNLFERIIFMNHYADMMGGEGNAYANIFREIEYLNPVFAPVDYDFHGFSEGPMSPPAENVFYHVRGFRYMKSAGSITHLPSCAKNNAWISTVTEGERKGDYLFYAMTYRQKKGLLRIITAVGYAVAMVQKSHSFSPGSFTDNVREKLRRIDSTGVARSQHHNMFFPKSRVINIITTGRIE